MRGAFRIGRLFGIDVGVDRSWGIVFALMAWNLTAVFHGWHPTWALLACCILALFAVLLFFASVLAHEFAHALVARSFGMSVRDIRLFLFGGVSNIEREPSSPGAEFWMAIAGPLTSFGLGVAFVALAAATLSVPPSEASDPVHVLSGLGPISTLFLWLGPVNVIVGVFNLLPGFPLDGGRVLRAILWKASGDLRRATLAATIGGRTLGWTFLLMGLAMVFGATLPVFGGGAGSGVWLTFVGWFLSSAASRSSDALAVARAS